MAREYLRRMLTPTVRAAQAHYYGRAYPHQGDAPQAERLGPDELAFVAARDSFYLATVTEDGWPCVQHRGGPRGFLVATGPDELLFADYGGNRQLISAGSVQHEQRVSLLMVDYPSRTRLKLLGTAEVLDAREHPDLVERVFRVRVVASDWNCPKFLTERYTRREIAQLMRPLQLRIEELEAQLARR